MPGVRIMGDGGEVMTRFILLLSGDAYAMQLCDRGPVVAGMRRST
jgi:hypothetical protein